MVDAAITDTGVGTRQNGMDVAFRAATWFFAFFVLFLLFGIVAALLVGALPAFQAFGWNFLVDSTWDPVKKIFGAFPLIYGTLVTSAIAMLFGVPLAFGVAIFITELCPPWLKRPVGTLIELLAAIPSIIYGIWGLFVLAPLLQTHVQPVLIDSLGKLPWVGALFEGPPLGIGMLTAGVILAIMVLPFMASVFRDVFETVPTVLKESAYGIGATTAEVVWNIVLPSTRVGVIGGIMLGLGRALGETMAVTFVIGNAHIAAVSLFSAGTTISATLANEFSEADSPLYVSALLGSGFVLSVMTLLVLAAAKYMLIRLQRQAGS
ncbi:MAG TPA: phosphate ABC transporter permease subunit PstC [Stellaceae bacterium]|nr:phosphate ABC transporter permease subunit PstC [Stellaceae bacterium]